MCPPGQNSPFDYEIRDAKMQLESEHLPLFLDGDTLTYV